MNAIELLPILCSVALLLGLLLYLGHPLLTSGRVGVASGPTRQLFERKEQLLGEIVELELDRELGKVSAEDFQRLFAELEAETLADYRRAGSDQRREHLSIRTTHRGRGCGSCAKRPPLLVVIAVGLCAARAICSVRNAGLP